MSPREMVNGQMKSYTTGVAKAGIMIDGKNGKPIPVFLRIDSTKKVFDGDIPVHITMLKKGKNGFRFEFYRMKSDDGIVDEGIEVISDERASEWITEHKAQMSKPS